MKKNWLVNLRRTNMRNYNKLNQLDKSYVKDRLLRTELGYYKLTGKKLPSITLEREAQKMISEAKYR